MLSEAVPHQGLQVDHVDGGEAVLLPEGGLRGHILGGGLPHAGGHQLHHGVVGDELEGVLVAGDHHAVPARPPRHLREMVPIRSSASQPSSS